jgi:glycosyltransferase involved in cell wall biosynthesis
VKIVQVSHYKLPVARYGGTQRVILWNARALRRLGHEVVLLSMRGTRVDDLEVVEMPDGLRDYEAHVPPGADIVHLYATPPEMPRVPYIVTIGGNGKPGERYAPNTVFVSENHARRHGSGQYVYNGIDPGEFVYRDVKDDYFLFLSKASWKVKGLGVALELAKRCGIRLVVAGGRGISLNRRIRYAGMVGGARKAELLAGAKALLFPIQWDEPFGLVAAEALMSGTPVITFDRGSMPEIVTDEVGFRCRSANEMEEAIKAVERISPSACRARAEALFSSEAMARSYLDKYRRILERGRLDDAPSPTDPGSSALGARQ